MNKNLDFSFIKNMYMMMSIISDITQVRILYNMIKLY